MLHSLSAIALESVINQLTVKECERLEKAISQRKRRAKEEEERQLFEKRLAPLFDVPSVFQEELHSMVTTQYYLDYIRRAYFVDIQGVVYSLGCGIEVISGVLSGENLWVMKADWILHPTKTTRRHAVRIFRDGTLFIIDGWHPPQRLVDFVCFLWNNGFYKDAPIRKI